MLIKRSRGGKRLAWAAPQLGSQCQTAFLAEAGPRDSLADSNLKPSCVENVFYPLGSALRALWEREPILSFERFAWEAYPRIMRCG
ncbi:hypothetical protein CYLTODRAFT_426939 [Cylindrobasidium torrendii FP15055 ss-10]|uniref:Uncharacterized protein n=1 Tax=Cylindrobasidium torrendii FP15055 ss-10 TaxID=1314674 RepID=A0A0D7AWP6_9AGAR|nr:hypothetical protein CYLTODRAFT_426939 [Cylindrobasidium torrendii FP15055 ss-10]